MAWETRQYTGDVLVTGYLFMLTKTQTLLLALRISSLKEVSRYLGHGCLTVLQPGSHRIPVHDINLAFHGGLSPYMPSDQPVLHALSKPAPRSV
jgi:hypothetical protein